MLGFHEILSRFGPHEKHGRNYRVECPAHNDSPEHKSLDIAEGDNGTPLFVCRTQHCQTSDILAARGLTWADILPDRNGHQWDRVHEYRTRDGALNYRVYRHGTGKEKEIRQQRADGTWSLDGVARVPYRLPQITGPTVVIVEGEACVDTLWPLGIQATCNVGGAGNWRPSDTEALKAAGVRDLVILPDQDEAGEKHASRVKASALEAGLAVRVVRLPDLPPKGDVVDWLRDHTPEALYEALEPPLPPTLAVDDATTVIAEGQAIAAQGIKFLVDTIIPAYGMLGFMVAYAKVGKTTLGQYLAACIARGEPFLEKATDRCRVLVIAAEDPPEYTAYLARHLEVPEGVLSFARVPLKLDVDGLQLIVDTVKQGRYGFVLIASWQAVVAGLIKDENDNAGAVQVVERVKLATRETGIPWLIDAHAGKGEDQADDADPTKAMRGASSAAGSADYLLSLRYVEQGTFKTERRLSGKGRFVNLEPLTIDYDVSTGAYALLGATKNAFADSTWAQIQEMGALTEEWAGCGVIATRAGFADSPSKASGAASRKVKGCLMKRYGVERQEVTVRGNKVWQFRLAQSTAPTQGGGYGAVGAAEDDPDPTSL